MDIHPKSPYLINSLHSFLLEMKLCPATSQEFMRYTFFRWFAFIQPTLSKWECGVGVNERDKGNYSIISMYSCVNNEKLHVLICIHYVKFVNLSPQSWVSRPIFGSAPLGLPPFSKSCYQTVIWGTKENPNSFSIWLNDINYISLEV